MKLIIKDKNVYRINKFIDSLLYIFGYTLVLFLVDMIFNSFDIDNYWFGLLAVIIIYILNKTIKPIIVKLTLPITALTLGLFYPFINLFILKIVDFILNDHFQIYGIVSGILIAIFISIMNFFVEELVIKPIIRRCDK
ncbi:MAG: phage holin family protein [Bacilli bacterium]|nr:phage holin family protein [Bacilli bacterium]